MVIYFIPNTFRWGSLAYSLTRKLKSTKIALKVRNTIHFGNINQQIDNAICLIDTVQQSNFSPQTSDEEFILKKQLDLFLQEKTLCKNKSRKT